VAIAQDDHREARGRAAHAERRAARPAHHDPADDAGDEPGEERRPRRERDPETERDGDEEDDNTRQEVVLEILEHVGHSGNTIVVIV